MADTEHEVAEATFQADANASNDGIVSPQPLRVDKARLTTGPEWKEIGGMESEESHEPNGVDSREFVPEDAPAEDAASSETGNTGEGETGTVDQDESKQHEEPQSVPEGPFTPQELTTEAVPEPRARSDSRSTTATQATQATHRSTPVSSTVFVVTALEAIAASKDAKRNKALEDAVQKALANIKQSDTKPLDPEVIFLPLQLATKTFSIPLQVTALDCIGKLITYSYFAFPSSRPGQDDKDPANKELPLIERAIETICDCFENEATPVEIQQQIIKSLLAAVLNDKIVVHGAGLLKASSQNQQIAQGSLTQMLGTVFDRVRMRLDLKEARLREPEDHQETPVESTIVDPGEGSQLSESMEAASTVSDQPTQKEPREKLTLQSFESSKDDTMVTDNVPTMVTRARPTHRSTRSVSNVTDEKEDEGSEDEVDEIYVKDAFLVFRAMCKLSHKTLTHDQQQDIKSQNMRSKLLSLHLIHHLINNHITVFTSPLATIRNSASSSDSITLLHAIRPHLCLSLSRNGSSSVPKVFEVCCEIFWLMLKYMRVMLKKELEVFLKEIYLAILERRNSPAFQKQYFMEILERLSGDSRATALENIFQNLIEQISRFVIMPVPITGQHIPQEIRVKSSTTPDWHQRGTLPPNLTTSSLTSTAAPSAQNGSPELAMKYQALDCLVEILRSLDSWSSQRLPSSTNGTHDDVSRKSVENYRESIDAPSFSAALPSPYIDSGGTGTGRSTPAVEDDPNEIEKARQRKAALSHAIQQFNFKPKRGIKLLLKDGFIRSDSPKDIASFLLRNDRLDKAMIGEYLGEGDPENVAIMHAFVDTMDFTKRRFVDALRQFLQSFRLPGEAQKIDRFMLKFAERYLAGNPNSFANADTAYVLAYSVIMLNTDQHSSKLKGPRMTKEDFIKNNRGINDNADLPDEYLNSIFDEIAKNEIVLDSEREHAANQGIPTATPAGFASRAGQVFATVGRDIQGEKYAQASEEMANKTEQLYRSLIKSQRRTAVKDELSRFIPATSVRHVGSMFNVTWTSFLSGLSAPLQETQDIEKIRLCMEGLKLAIRISCSFDLETPRVAFVTALAKFTNLGNLREMSSKNLEALKILLEVAVTEGNHLRDSWREILTCVSQLDRFQLLSDGVDEGTLPDVSRTRIVPSNSNDTSKRLTHSTRRRQRSTASTLSFRPEIALESRSAEMVHAVDRIFSNTANLSQEAIVDFVQALSEVSLQEIQSSGQSESPRTYSLQKVVEISYYNMTRVRIEWSRIWEILGRHFNEVGCQSNTNVVFFALDSLRQLSMRFMEIEELPGFKFQKDFLKPFEHIMANSNTVTVKDMVLRCLIQMIQARGHNIRSGWKTMFGVFTVAAREPYEGIVNMAFEHVTQIYNTRFGVVISQGAFADLIICLTEFSKNIKFQKKSLQAIETLKASITKMLKTPECPLSRKHIPATEATDVTGSILKHQLNRQTQEEQFWYPVLIAFQDVLMTGDDLEVRSRALNYLFETLIRYGGDFPQEFWDVLWRQLLYPIFVVLQSKSEMSKVPNHEELSVWLSTTMIQALRHMITLFTHYFDALQGMLNRFLGLLNLCICQENDTIARIGSNCLQQLILQNVTKFSDEHWGKIVGAFVELFDKTTAYELFTAASPIPSKMPTSEVAKDNGDSTINGVVSVSETSVVTSDDENASTINEAQTPLTENGDAGETSNGTLHDTAAAELEDYRPQAQELTQQSAAVTVARRRFFNRIITNCVLQLLMIETVHELFSNDNVYDEIPSPELLRLMGLLKKSYQFAKKFNEDKDLRMQLWRQGFMKQPPNLLKQESGSAATYVNILFRMYSDEREERKSSRVETETALVPLCADIIRSYVRLDEETQHRNIVAWRPVVVDVMEGYVNFPQDNFTQYIDTFYPLAIDLLGRELASSEIRHALQSLLQRVGEVKLGLTFPHTAGAEPSSSANSIRTYSRGH
uniref:Protein transport protein SEC7 n=1 Tax=Talaromyces marneffei PM1 TaxID=1077442 RepID=A0A093URP6_TALMA